MIKPKIITIDKIGKIDPKNDCFIIKKYIDKELCFKLKEYTLSLKKKYAPNEKFEGENWYYKVSKNRTEFIHYMFNELEVIKNKKLTSVYKKIFDLYALLGEFTHYNNFESEIKIKDSHTEYKIINPLIFHYENNKSIFEFHKHDARTQAFQLLVNLSQPGVDYNEGETIVYMQDKRPDILNNKDLYENSCVFGDEFEMGDLFSFPYNKWHMVKTPVSCSEESSGRMSLLMPLSRRNNENYKNEYL